MCFSLVLCRQWLKLAHSPTTFCTHMDGAQHDSEVIEIAQEDVSQAAVAADIEGWDGICLISPKPAVKSW